MRRLKGLKGDQDLNETPQSVEFDDLKGRSIISL